MRLLEWVFGPDLAISEEKKEPPEARIEAANERHERAYSLHDAVIKGQGDMGAEVIRKMVEELQK